MLQNKNIKFILYAAGIFNCYFYFGILQERITRGKYVLPSTDNEQTEQTERFTYSLALCMIVCSANYVFAKFMLYFWQQPEDKTRTWYYASSALTYILAMVCSNMALQWVPYPMQVVGKSAKPIPVMLLGVLVGRKSYTIKKYFFVFLIVFGVVLFMLKDKAGETNDMSLGIGQILLLLSLVMDGLTGAVQERMRAETAPSAQHMMVSMNAWSILFLIVALVFTGEGFRFGSFCIRHPEIFFQMSMLAVAGALGQLFILLMVSEFGPLPCAIVTTTRKFFTVLGSIFFFGNVLTTRQWIGTIAVFSGLFLDSIFGKSPPKKLNNSIQ